MKQNRHPHARMLDEVLLQGYNISFKRLSVNVINRIGNTVKYQVFNEKDNSSNLYDNPSLAINEFLSLKKRNYG
jgi:hypothetical protein